MTIHTRIRHLCLFLAVSTVGYGACEGPAGNETAPGDGSALDAGIDAAETASDTAGDADGTEPRDTASADACQAPDAANLPDASPNRVVATEAQRSAIAVDGRLDERQPPVIHYDDSSGESDNRGTVFARWTPDALHLGLEVTDDEITIQSSADPWNNDSLEIAVDPDASGGDELQGDEQKWVVVADGMVRHSQRSSAGGWTPADETVGRATARETDDGYTAELSIPWSEIGGFDGTNSGEIPALYVVTNDRDDEGVRRFGWTGSVEQLGTPAEWGTLQLVSTGSASGCGNADASASDTDSTDTSDAGTSADGDTGEESDRRLKPARHVTEDDFDFRTTLDAVDDLGMDPAGEESIDDALEQARAPHTLIEFPPGKYKISAGPDRNGTHQWNDVQHFGIKGLGDKPKDVQFVVEQQPANYGGRWLGASGGRGLMLKNFAFQMHRDRYTSADIAVNLSDLVLIEAVEWAGILPTDDHTNDALVHIGITDVDGVGEINRLYIREGSYMPGYPKGLGGVWMGPSHQGTLHMTDMWLENINSSAFRFTNVPGRVGVEGGFFKNNANTNLRGGAGSHPDGPSYIRGATVVIDNEDVNDYQPEGEDLTGTSVLSVDASSNAYTGLIVEDLDIDIRNVASGTTPTIIRRPSFGGHGAFTVRNTRIANHTSALLSSIQSVSETNNDTARLENVHITGSGDSTLRVSGGTSSEIVDSCVESNFGIGNFDVVDNVSRSNCESLTAPTTDPHEH